MLQFDSDVLNQLKDVSELVSDFIILHSVSHFCCQIHNILNTDFIISGASLTRKIQNILHLEEAVLSTKSARTHISHNKEMNKPLRSKIGSLKFH